MARVRAEQGGTAGDPVAVSGKVGVSPVTAWAVVKKRGYSDEFPTTREKRVYFMLDKIPPALWIRVKAKAKREGVSLRSLILKWCSEWVERETR